MTSTFALFILSKKNLTNSIEREERGYGRGGGYGGEERGKSDRLRERYTIYRLRGEERWKDEVRVKEKEEAGKKKNDEDVMR